MKRRGFESFKKKLLRGAVAGMMTLTMTLGLFPGIGSPITAKAIVDYAATKTITGLGTGAIGDPKTPEVHAAWTGSYVYYGKYNNKQLKYRVLDAETDRFSGTSTTTPATKTMLLDCDNVLYDRPFYNYGQDFVPDGVDDIWNNIKSIKTELGSIRDNMNQVELNSVFYSNIASHDLGAEGEGVPVDSYLVTNYHTYIALIDCRIFLLDIEDVCNSTYGYAGLANESQNHKKNDLNGSPHNWWLRSCWRRDQCAARVGADGNVNDPSRADNALGEFSSGVSPAFNVKLSSVMFSSLIANDPAYGSTAPAAGAYGACYKLTLLDPDLSIDVTDGAQVTGTGNTITIPYTISGTNAGNANRVSVLITSEAYQQGKVVTDASKYDYLQLETSNGVGTFELPAKYRNKTWGTDFHVYILAEDVNSEFETDYASAPVEIGPTVVATVTGYNGAYDGNAHSLSITNVNTTGTTVLYGTSASNCNQSSPVSIREAGTGEIYYKITKNGYNPNVGHVTVMVNMATTAPGKPAATMKVPYLTKHVYDATLPSNLWKWNVEDAGTELSVGEPVQVRAFYDGEDKDNYTSEAQTATVTVTREACKHPKTKIINRVVPTTEKEGYSGDTYCTDCKTTIQKGHVEEKSFKPVTVNYITHIQNKGWETVAKKNGESSGTTGSALRLEGIKIKVTGNENLSIQYTTHCQDYGWLAWSNNGEMNGTEGESKRLEAIMINLTGADKDKYDVYYRVHAQNVGWMNWAKNGEAAGTAGYAYRLEAIQIQVVKKGAKPVNVGNIKTNSAKSFDDKNRGAAPQVANSGIPNLSYRTHVHNVGWQAWRTNGGFSGTSGRSLRLEGINIKLTNKDHTGGIRYKTHIQNIGWEKDWRVDGAMSGTSGRALRLEAIEIELYGEMANYYDVYYRVHAQNVGWMGWAKNGADAGTAGYGRRLEGIQIVLVKKGAAAPATNLGGINSVTPNPYLVTGSAAATPGRSQTVVPAQPGSTSTVYVTATGTKYHNDGCTSLRDSKIAISLEDAQKRGYEPCKLCH